MTFTFPAWAPASLVRKYAELQAQIADRRATGSAEDEEYGIGELFPNDELKPPEPVSLLEELANALFRLLTHPDMRLAWTALNRPPAPRQPLIDPEFLLWYMIERALKDFRILMAHPQTPKERRKSLLSIVSKAKALQEAITAEPLAKEYAKRLTATYLTKKNTEYQREEGGILGYEQDERWYQNLSSDCKEAARDREIRAYYFDGCNWDKTPLPWRLAFWAREAKDTGLNDLLQVLMDYLEEEAAFSTDIKQPGRRDAALKSFLIRRISSYFWYYYRQPLDDVVAQIVSVVLNLETPLTRDDVRPYLSPTGRKSREVT